MCRLVICQIGWIAILTGTADVEIMCTAPGTVRSIHDSQYSVSCILYLHLTRKLRNRQEQDKSG